MQLLRVFALVLLVSCSSLAAAGELPIAQALDEKDVDVLVLGWGHFFGNHVIPRLLIEELSALREETQARTVLILEWPEGAAESSFDFAGSRQTEIEHLRQVMWSARMMGIRVIFGDHPGRLRREVSFGERDRHFAMVAVEEVRKGFKAVVWVGGLHGVGIARHLRRSQVKFESIITNYNVFTGEVKLRDKWLPQADPDARVRAKFPLANPREGWAKIKQPESDYLDRFRVYAGRKIRRLCGSLLLPRDRATKQYDSPGTSSTKD